MAEGRRMMRLSRELPPDVFGALLSEYQQLVRDELEGMAGRGVEVDNDTVTAAYPTPEQSVRAAVAAQHAVTAHAWPHGRKLELSVGLDTNSAGAGLRCAKLCDAADGGQIFLTEDVSRLLEKAELGDLSIRDLGEVPLRRTKETVRAYELVLADAKTLGR